MQSVTGLPWTFQALHTETASSELETVEVGVAEKGVHLDTVGAVS